MSGTNQTGTVNTGGGAHVGGNVSAGGDFVGRDQLNIELVVGKLDDAAQAVSDLLRLQTQDDLVSASVAADLTALMEELRKTHSTIVKLVSPLRRIDDHPATFAQDFKKFYGDFRDFYDTQDFIDERTRCHKVAHIQFRLLRHNSPLVNSPEWAALQAQLSTLGTYDDDVITRHYIPFMQNLNMVIDNINGLVDLNQIDEAITLKRSLLNSLAPQFEKTKAMLQQMSSIINDLTSRL
jgi:hypothetical protein